MSHDEARAEFARQLEYEKLGALAYKNGWPRDCPYNQTTESFQWNHWIYGYDNEKGNK